MLKGSDYAEEHRLAFLKAQIVFWLIAATDGHAKNFSIFLLPGGRFRMTPLYDIMSVQPNYAQGELRRRQIRLSMAVGGNRHYIVDQILPRHFIQSAEVAGIPAERTLALMQEMAQRASSAFARARKTMPQDFPDGLA